MKITTLYSYLFVGLAALMTACSGEFQTYTISDTYATSLHYSGSSQGAGAEEEDERKGVPAKSYYNGDLIGGAIWWARKGIVIDKEEDFLVIAEAIGPDSTPFGATFPPLDFVSEEVQIKVTARAEYEEGDAPTLVLQMQDGGGYFTNEKTTSITIKNTEEVEEYFFTLDDVFKQKTPVPHLVNGGFINSLQVLINPGGPAFTGKIFIEEIKVVPVKSEE